MNLLNEIRDVIVDMVDDSGNIRTLPIGKTGSLNLSSERITLLENLIRLVRYTAIVCNETKYYLFNHNVTMRGVSDELNKTLKEGEKEFNEHTTLAKIQYDKNKLIKIFGEDIIVDTLSNVADIDMHNIAVVRQYLNYEYANNLRGNLIIDIPKDNVQLDISESAFNEFIESIEIYTKRQIELISTKLEAKACGYFNYLVITPSITEEDIERLNLLNKLLDISNVI